MKINHLILILLITNVSFSFDRNYYGDELVLSNQCLPKNINFGQPGNDPNGPSWWEAIQNCTDTGILTTKWGTTLAWNITVYSLDGDRLNGLIYSTHTTEISPVETKGYKQLDALKYSSGMVPIMANALDGRMFVQQDQDNPQCLYTDNQYVQNITSRGINSYHKLFPYVHVVETPGRWCFEKP